jgi:hypothetical protein
VLNSGDVKIALLASGEAFADGHSGSVRTRGYVDPGEVSFEPARPLSFGIVSVTSKGSVGVAWPDGRMQASAISKFVNWDGAPPTVPVTCADLSFGADTQPASLGSSGSSDGGPKGGDPVLWSGSAPIAADANGKPVGSVDTRDAILRVLERRGDRTHVRLESASETVVGWVPSSAVMTAAQAKKKKEEEQRQAAKASLTFVGSGLYDGPIGPLTGAVPGKAPVDTSPEGPAAGAPGSTKPSEMKTVEGLTCPASLRLMTELHGQRTWIGTLDPGASVTVVAREGGVARVQLTHATAGGFRPPRDQVLEVPARDIASCTVGIVKDN